MLPKRLLPVLLLLLGTVALPAQTYHRSGAVRGFSGGFSSFGHHGGFGGFRGFGGFGVALPAYGAIAPLYAGPVFGGYGYGFGYGSPGYYPSYGYDPAPPQYGTVILEATHDWRYWSPTTRVIVGPVQAGADRRVIGMGVPAWTMNEEPLGDVARRYRTLAAQKSPPWRFIIRIEN